MQLRNFLFRLPRYDRLPNPAISIKRSRYWHLCKRIFKYALSILLISGISVYLVLAFGESVLDYFDNRGLPYTNIDASTKLHVLVPASRSNPNLCKTTLSLQLLGYPTPTFMGWEERFDDHHQIDGGAQIGTKVIYALHSLLKSPAHDDDLVLIADGYDTWFQLPPEVLVRRFNAMNRDANVRIAKKAGKRAVRSLKIGQKIVFGARRSCDSARLNGGHCVAAPTPPSPTSWYGEAISSVTQQNADPPRYLDSGYIMGRMIDVRTLLMRAKEIIDITPGSEDAYYGSPQPIFNQIYTDQEAQRSRWYQKLLPTYLSSKLEYGIGIDYFSELSHSTMDSERDAEYLTYYHDGEVALSSARSHVLKPQLAGHYLRDCNLNVPTRLPHDIAESRPPFIKENDTLPSNLTDWHNIPLLTNLCTGTIPVLIHHNGDKTLRDSTWRHMWFAPHAKDMLQKVTGAAGGWTDTRKWIEWEELCPPEWEGMLFDTQGT